MSPAEELLREMRERGVRLEAHGAGVRVVDGELDDDDLARLRLHKAALRDLLAPTPAPAKVTRTARSPAPVSEAVRRQRAAEQLLAELRAAGVRLHAWRGRIAGIDQEIDGPTRDRIRALKAELLPLLPQLRGLDRVLYGADYIA